LVLGKKNQRRRRRRLDSYSSEAEVARGGETSPWRERRSSGAAVRSDATLMRQEQWKGEADEWDQCRTVSPPIYSNIFLIYSN
jgi:hypothetical protein